MERFLPALLTFIVYTYRSVPPHAHLHHWNVAVDLSGSRIIILVFGYNDTFPMSFHNGKPYRCHIPMKVCIRVKRLLIYHCQWYFLDPILPVVIPGNNLYVRYSSTNVTTTYNAKRCNVLVRSMLTHHQSINQSIVPSPLYCMIGKPLSMYCIRPKFLRTTCTLWLVNKWIPNSLIALSQSPFSFMRNKCHPNRFRTIVLFSIPSTFSWSKSRFVHAITDY